MDRRGGKDEIINALMQISWQDLDVDRFGRFLAKIAHGSAAAGGDFERFGVKPILAPLILGKLSPFPLSYLVGGFFKGGTTDPLDPFRYIHNIRNDCIDTVMGGRTLITTIQLFGNMGAPIYKVI